MRKSLIAFAVFMMTTGSAWAGGILTNTNQSVDFLRNPARDAAIGLDGVYSNPAGVVFMPEGFHLGINWQYAHQTRTITSTNPVFQMGRKNNANSPTKIFEGVANAPIIPSIQIAYNMEHWSLQANLSVPGGGGACEFEDGLGSFESVVYKAKISNIEVKTAQGYVDFGSYLQAVTAAGYGEQVAPLQKYAEGVNLLCNQDGIGFAPIVGVDYKTGRFNFAAKYEFRTQIRMKNESTVNEASEIEAVNKFRDGEKVNEDMPALLTVGVQYSPIDAVRINAGWHHFFDKDASWYNHSQELLSHNTNEFLLGAEWDTTEKLTFSAGGQLTRYGMTDEYISDMSFVVNSYSIGFGFSYQLSKRVAVKAAYFQTYYGDYDRTNADNPQIKDSFTRTNRVFGVGCQLDF